MRFKSFSNFWIYRFKLFCLIFYRNIPYYTQGKGLDNDTWFYHMRISYLLLDKNIFLLVYCLLRLNVEERCTISYINALTKPFWRNVDLLLYFFSFKFLFSTIEPDLGDFILTHETRFFYKSLKKVRFENYNLFLLKYIYILYFFSKSILISFIISFFFLFYLVYFFDIILLNQLAIWFILGNLFFWLLSGFNFFLKRYSYSKFTSAVQRFWKRANSCFWAVEGFLFLLFYYYFFNSSQEPLYMYDYSSLNQDFLLDLEKAYVTLYFLGFLFFIFTFILLSLSFFSFYQFIGFLFICSCLIFYIFFLESYQFIYLVSMFTESIWCYDDEYNSWQLTYDSPRLRTKNYYFSLCLIAKYWHFMFIFLGWVFFLLKVFEYKKLSYILFSYNMQNFLILFLLNLATYSQWVKFLFRRFLDLNYFWFYTKYDFNFISSFIFELIAIFRLPIIFFKFNIYYSFINKVIYSNNIFGYESNLLFNII